MERSPLLPRTPKSLPFWYGGKPQGCVCVCVCFLISEACPTHTDTSHIILCCLQSWFACCTRAAISSTRYFSFKVYNLRTDDPRIQETSVVNVRLCARGVGCFWGEEAVHSSLLSVRPVIPHCPEYGWVGGRPEFGLVASVSLLCWKWKVVTPQGCFQLQDQAWRPVSSTSLELSRDSQRSLCSC